MAYGLTANGFTLKTFADIQEEVEDYERLHISEGLELSDDSDLGQVNVAHINQLALLWELAQGLWAAYDADTANDWSLDQLAALTGTLRNKYSSTVVTAQVTLNPNKALPAGSIANLSDRPNSRFISLTDVPADAAGGSFDVDFESETKGAIDVIAGQLDEIYVAVSGWTAITNAAAGVPGSQPELDPDFRDKRESELTASGSTNLDAIIAGVSKVTSVVDVNGVQNDTDLTVGILPPHSVGITVRGGADADLAEAIFIETAGGIGTAGTTAVVVEDSQGTEHTIRFTRAAPLTFYATTVIDKNDDWNGTTSEDEVKAAISAYINSLGVADDVIYDRVKATYVNITGVDLITSLFIGFSASPSGTSDLAVSDSEYATSDVANISVTAP